MTKKIAIIGAGISGLSTGIYARLNGYDVEIFESHSIPGGLCTAWKRKGFIFDACIHWLVGSNPNSTFHPLLREVGAVQGRTFIHPEAYSVNTGADGRICTLYGNPARLEATLLGLSPGDAVPIRHLGQLVRAMQKLKIPVEKAPELMGVLDLAKLGLQMGPIAREFSYCTKTSIAEFAARFQDPLIRDSILASMDPAGALFALTVTLADVANGNAGYPIGGSLPVALAIERRCKDLGARIHYKTRVKSIRVEGGRACGLELEDGRKVSADVVISAANLRGVLDNLLDGRFPSPKHEELFRSGHLHPSCALVFFGLNKVFPQALHAVSQVLVLDKPFQFAAKQFDWVRWLHHNDDPTLAPEGKSVITAMIDMEYESWSNLGYPSEEYQRAKAELARHVQAALETALPGFSAAVEKVEVSTPLTIERYTSSHRGTYITWFAQKNRLKETQLISKTVPGLKDFYMTGVWLMGPGGLPTAIKTGRDVIQALCHRDGVRFKTKIPEVVPTPAPWAALARSS